MKHELEEFLEDESISREARQNIVYNNAMKFYKLTPADVVVFYDEIDLAPGRFRMKTGGGAAGNNGIRSVTAQASAARSLLIT